MQKSTQNYAESIQIYAELEESPQHIDLDKLALAVATAETQNCTTGMGVTRNNCFGIMTWARGFREGKTYASKDESYDNFKQIWTEKYSGGYPSHYEAKRWVGGDPTTWLKNVAASYNK